MMIRIATMAVGISLVSLLPQLPPFTAVIVGLLMALWLSFRSIFLPLWLMLGASWGVGYGYYLLDTQLPETWQQQLLWVEGEVVGLPETDVVRGEEVLRFELSPESGLCRAESVCRYGMAKLKLNWYQPQALSPGQHWRFQVILKRPYGMANPGGFDYQSWLIQQGVAAVGRVVNGRQMDKQHGSIDRLRWRLGMLLDHAVPDLQRPELIKALLLGDKRDISRQQWDLFALTGTTHLMVISGLHIGLVGSLVFVLTRWLILCLFASLAAERWAACLALLLAGIYALAAGFTLPTQRALIMMSVVMLALLGRRYLSPIQGMVIAVLLCLLVDPLAPVSLSFYLSFLAVACLCYGGLGRYPAAGLFSRLWSAQCLVFIGLLPVLAVFIGRLTFLSPVANIIAVPLFSGVIVPGNFIAAVLMLLDSSLALSGAFSLAQGLWRVLDRLLVLSLDYLQGLVDLLGEHSVDIPGRPLPIIGLSVLAVVVLLLPKGFPAKYWGVLLLLPMVFYQAPKLPLGDMRLSVLDVGQGLAVVINTRQHTLVYDLGPKISEDFDTASAVVSPFLNSIGASRVDLLVLSHGDNDHAGGWPAFIQRIAVRDIVFGEPAKAQFEQAKGCEDQTPWQWDQVSFEFLLVQSRETTDKANNRSCVLKVTAGEFSVLLPGDIEQSLEAELLQQFSDQLPASLLLAPHHGSLTSSSWPFLKTVAPEAVVISSGYLNPFGHPHRSILSRYHALDIDIYRTDKAGAISFEVQNGRLLEVTSYRSQHRHYWLQGNE